MPNLSMVVTLACLTSGSLAFADRPADPVAVALGELRTAAKCEDKASVWRPWCTAAAYETGTAGALPRGKVLVGMTIELEQGKSAADALTTKVTFVALAISKDGKVKLTDVKPTSDAERRSVAEAVAATTLVFKGTAKAAKLPADLAAHFATLRGTYPAKRSGKAWAWTGASASQLRKVGAFWVAIEIPKANNGVFATVLTDAWE
ncbi:MAG: hypothetical protein M3680_29180 [Myxococcota bacterium]|nr:hypothetical protein [Myxococcota bacterium]